MRIGFDAKRVFNNFTGLGNYSRFVIDALLEHYPQNDYLLYTPRIKQHPEVQKYLDLQIRQPEGRPGAWWRTFSIADDIKKDKLDVYHGLSNELPLKKVSGVKTVVTVHDLIFVRFPEYYGMIDVSIYKWKLKRACESADVIVAVSQQTANDLKDFLGVDERKLHVVYQGCHPQFYKSISSTGDVRKKYDLPREFVLYLGTIEKRKNAGLLIKSIALMKRKVPVVLVGKPTKYMAELEELIDKYKVREYVKFIHHASFADLPAIYQSASVFVYPSVFEGFGIPIVEAIACGVPVITSNGSCFSEAGGPHCIYINPSNPEELSDSITMVLENTGLRTTMVDGSKTYISKFAPAVIASDLMKLYNA